MWATSVSKGPGLLSEDGAACCYGQMVENNKDLAAAAKQAGVAAPLDYLESKGAICPLLLQASMAVCQWRAMP